MVGLFGAAIGAGSASAIASSNRKFQERMFKTRYQMTMADMKAAGLNPMLAANLGAGQPPQGSMAQTPDWASAFTNSAKDWREARMQSITRDKAETDANIAEGQLRITDANADIAEMHSRVQTSAHGEAAYSAGLLPGATKPSATIKYIWDRVSGRYVKPPKSKKSYPPYKRGYGKTRDIFGKHKPHKRGGASGRY